MATKQLAKQLGLIRKSSKLSYNSKNACSPKSKQYFEYLIIIDFESTCWKDSKHYGQEIIEFPAVLLNTSNGEIESEFHTYVQPQEHPILSEFCTELTGIKQQQVDEGVPLKICLSQFSSWIQKIQKEKMIVFLTTSPERPTSEQKMCGFVTWSDWDLGVCLLYECKRKQLRKPEILNSWIDLRATYKLFYNRKPKGLNGALQDLGIEFSGREHSGLDDSRNTAKLAWRMICDGCVLKITKSLDQVRPKVFAAQTLPAQQCFPGPSGGIRSSIRVILDVDKQPSENSETSSHRTQNTPKPHSVIEVNGQIKQDDTIKPSSGIKIQEILPPQTLINGLTTTLGNGHKQRSGNRNPFNLQIGAFTSTPVGNSSLGHGHLLVSTTISTVNDISALNISSSTDCISMLADWEDAAVIEDSQETIKSDELKGLTSVLDNSSTSLLSKNGQQNCHGLTNLEDIGFKQHLSNSNSVVYKSADTTIYNVKQQVSHGSTFKLPSTLASKPTNNVSTNRLRQQNSTPTLLNFFPKRKLSSVSFYSPPKKQPFTIHEDQGSTCNRSLPLASNGCHGVLHSTVNMSDSFRLAKNGRITAPMCKCGRRAKKLTVSSIGPNQGKTFYSCTVRKRNDEIGKGCDYFKWEDTLLKEKAAHSSSLLSTSRHSVSSGTTFLSSGASVSRKTFSGLRPSMRT
ncbi:ERI1 exoribonuclease 2 [Spea bombifrons]|uniref:ERI1 exoribonuclease 2 n=1 Tax=Spea bombifrons TaxID=233779 RepID=UPI0023493F46|nr:ERI1 exoribonuclease 2 [Spea bombifrons]